MHEYLRKVHYHETGKTGTMKYPSVEECNQAKTEAALPTSNAASVLSVNRSLY